MIYWDDFNRSSSSPYFRYYTNKQAQSTKILQASFTYIVQCFVELQPTGDREAELEIREHGKMLLILLKDLLCPFGPSLFSYASGNGKKWTTHE